jgi:hypothetical protein
MTGILLLVCGNPSPEAGREILLIEGLIKNIRPMMVDQYGHASVN